MDKEFDQVKDLDKILQYGDQMEKIGLEVCEEYDGLKRCKELLVEMEHSLSLKRSIIIGSLEEQDVARHRAKYV